MFIQLQLRREHLSRDPILSWPREQIGKVASLVGLDDVVLLQCSAVGIALDDYEPEKYKTRFHTTASSSEGIIKPNTQKLVDVTDGFDVIVHLNYDHIGEEYGRDEHSEPFNYLKIEALFALTYFVKVPVDQFPDNAKVLLEAEDIRAFSRYNATYNAWSYWREFVQSMSNRLGLPAITIPIFPVPNLVAPSLARSADTSSSGLPHLDG